MANYLADAIQVVDAESARSWSKRFRWAGPRRSRSRARARSSFMTRPLAQPVVQLQHLPQRRAHERPRLRHPERRPPGPEHSSPAQPQKGPNAAPGDRDQALDLARLADRAWTMPHGRVVHQEHAGPTAQGRGCQSADCLSRHARISPEPLSRAPTAVFRPRPSAGARSFIARAKAACNTCHGGPELTDGKIHEVGLEERDDAYEATTLPRSAASTTKTPTSTTAAPRRCAKH